MLFFESSKFQNIDYIKIIEHKNKFKKYTYFVILFLLFAVQQSIKRNQNQNAFQSRQGFLINSEFFFAISEHIHYHQIYTYENIIHTTYNN